MYYFPMPSSYLRQLALLSSSLLGGSRILPARSGETLKNFCRIGRDARRLLFVLQQAAEKDPYASLPLNRLAATYCKYASARRFSRASPRDLFEQPARDFFQYPARGLALPFISQRRKVDDQTTAGLDVAWQFVGVLYPTLAIEFEKIPRGVAK